MGLRSRRWYGQSFVLWSETGGTSGCGLISGRGFWLVDLDRRTYGRVALLIAHREGSKDQRDVSR